MGEHDYVIEARYLGTVVAARLTTTGWRMTVERDGVLLRADDQVGAETAYRMAQAVLDVLASELIEPTPVPVCACGRPDLASHVHTPMECYRRDLTPRVA